MVTPLSSFPRKAGIQAFQTFLDPGSALRCGRDECFYPRRAYFCSLLRASASAGSARAIARFASAISGERMWDWRKA